MVVASRIQREMTKELTPLRDDANIQVRHQDDYRLVPIRSSDIDVVRCSSATRQARDPVLDEVVTHVGFGERGLSVDLEGAPGARILKGCDIQLSSTLPQR